MEYGRLERAKLNLMVGIFLASVAIIWSGSKSRAEVQGDHRKELSSKIEKLELLTEKSSLELQKIKGSQEEPASAIELAKHLMDLSKLRRFLLQEIGKATLDSYEAPEVVEPLKQAKGILESIRVRHPKHALDHLLLLTLGKVLRMLGTFDSMVSTNLELIKKYPESSSFGPAAMLLADYYFGLNSLDRSQKFFRLVLRDKNPQLVNMARFKLGWIWINKDDIRKAIGFFEQVVRDGKGASSASLPKARKADLDLRRESLIAITFCYDRVRKSEQVFEYFSKFGLTNEETILVYRKLANRFYIKERFKDARRLYEKLIQLDRSDPEDVREWKARIKDGIIFEEQRKRKGK